MTAPALEFHQVSKKFRRGELYDSLRDLIPAFTGRLLRGKRSDALAEREFWAVRDVSFGIPRGEAFGIIGHNGAGKSTILKLLSGIMRPTVGTIAVRGRLSALIEVGAGFHPDLTGRENVYLNGTILGMTRKEIARKFDEIVAFADLEEFIDTPVKRYSSGMYARLGFAVAAHVDPDILVVDEVLSVGDYVFQRKCLERMSRIIGSGATVVFVSHNLRAVANLCGRALLLERGRAVTLGPSAEVIKTYLDRVQDSRGDTSDRDAYIAAVRVRSAQGETVTCRSGEDVWVDVDVVARRPTERMAVVLVCRDPEHYECFNTSTERLGLPPISLAPGQHVRCTFQLTLHLAQGTFHFGVALYRYDVQRTLDSWIPATTLFVSADEDVRGVAHLRPRVTVHEVGQA